MAEPLKNFFNSDAVRGIGEQLSVGLPELDVSAFTRACLVGLANLELTQRGWHIAAVMRDFLPSDFPQAVQVLTSGLEAPLTSDEGNGMAPFRYLPHLFYIAKYGIEHLEESLAAQYVLTQRFTAEFTIRVFLERYPDHTYAQLQTWASDPSVHVRRLVSEGTRPRLPWAPRLRRFQLDPTPVVALLERLKDDTERYVQRSVANNLNDIAKDHPDVVIDVCTQWLESPTPTRRWIVGHALRGLVKQGHPGALKLLGVGATPAIELATRQLPKRARIGEKVPFSVVLVSQSTHVQTLQVDYRVHFVKAGGKPRPKVFKLKRLELGPGANVTLKSTISFQIHTTRTPHAGPHAIELLVNGTTFELGTLDLKPAPV